MGATKPPAPSAKIQPAPQWSTRPGQKTGAQAGARRTGKPGPPEKPAVAAPDNRDPKGINAHIKVHFEDVLAEVGPETNRARSIDCVWRNSRGCYTCWKNCCYRMATLFCGICIACEYGFQISLYSFPCIWCVMPFYKCFQITMVGCFGRCYRLFADCCVGGVCEQMGEIFWPFRGHKKNPILPYQRAPKVTFNNNVKTKTIPRNTKAGVTVGPRSSGKVSPAQQKPAGNGPLQVKPAGGKRF